MTGATIVVAPLSQSLVSGESYTGSVVVRSTSTHVQHFMLSSFGPLAPWTVLSQSDVKLWPEESAEVSFTITLPSGPAPPAGSTYIEVAGRTHDGALVSNRQPAEVTPRLDIRLADLRPHAIDTPRRARYVAMPTNFSNVPVQLQVRAQDSEGRVSPERPPEGMLLEPGGSVHIPLTLRCTKVRWLGKPVPRHFSVDAIAADVEVKAAGVLTQLAIVPVWWMVSLLVLLTLVAANPGGWRWVFALGTVLLAAIFAPVAVQRLYIVRRGRATS